MLNHTGRNLLSKVIVGLVVAAGSVGAAFAQAGKPIEFRVASEAPPGQLVSISIERWVEAVNKESGGRFKGASFPAGQLFKDRDALQVIGQKGTLEFAVPNMAIVASVVPSLNALNLPFFLAPDTPERFQQVAGVDSPLGKRYQAEARARGIEMVLVRPIGSIILISKTPINALADLQRKKIRHWGGGVYAENAITRMGGSPVFVPAPEVASGLQQGVIDAAFGTVQFWSAALGDVAKYAIWSDGIAGVGQTLIANKEFWDGLSPADRKMLNDSAKKWLVDWLAEQLDNGVKEDLKKLEAKGAKISRLPATELAKAKQLTAPVWDMANEPLGKGFVDELRKGR
jgi:TRAP-type C4-dicarboxylate transport system substrate-binding protein